MVDARVLRGMHALHAMVRGVTSDALKIHEAAVHSVLHGTVRSCQTSSWSQWQDRVSNHSCVSPCVAASAVRHTMRQGQSRRDQTHCVSRGCSPAAVAALHVRWSSILELF